MLTKAEGGKQTWQSHRMFGTPLPFQNSAPSWYFLAFKQVIGEFFSERKSWRRFLHLRYKVTYTKIPFQTTHQRAISSAKADVIKPKVREREVHKNTAVCQ